MTQQVLQCRVKLPFNTPTEGQCSFDMIFEQVGTDTDLVPSEVATTIEGYLNATNGDGQIHPIAHYLSPVLNRASNACMIDMYDITDHLDGSPAGSPIYYSNFTLGATGASQGHPEGCCVLTSYRADYGSDTEYGPGDRPRARDRGRLYGPPMGTSADDSGPGSDHIWDSACLADFLSAHVILTTYASGADEPNLVQWSRKNAAVKHIDAEWTVCEQRAAYQRRRALR